MGWFAPGGLTMQDNASRLFVIVAILVVLNIFVPIIASSLDVSSSAQDSLSAQDMDDVQAGIEETGGTVTGFVTFIRFISGIFLWSFGQLPVWLDLLLLLSLRIPGYIITVMIARGVST